MTGIPTFSHFPPVPPPPHHFTGMSGLPPTRPPHAGGHPTPANFEFLMSLPIPPACARTSRVSSTLTSSDFESELGDEAGFRSGGVDDFAHLLHAHVVNRAGVSSPGASEIFENSAYIGALPLHFLIADRACSGGHEGAGGGSFAHNMSHGPFPFAFSFPNHHIHGPGARDGVFHPFGVVNAEGVFLADGFGKSGTGMGGFGASGRGGYGGQGGRGGHMARGGSAHRWLGW